MEIQANALVPGSHPSRMHFVQDFLLEPNTILMLLLFSHVLQHVNRFLWTKNLIYSEISIKLNRLNKETNKMFTEDGKEFSKYVKDILLLYKFSMTRAWHLCQNDLNENGLGKDILQKIQDFKLKIKIPFVEEISKKTIQPFKSTTQYC